MAAAHGALYAFFSLRLERSGYRVAAIGVLWTLGVLAEIVVFVFLPQLFRCFALATILVASFACAAARFVLLGWWADVVWLLVIAQLLHAATFGAFHGAAGALAAGALWQAGGPGLAFSASALAGLAGLHLAQALKRAGL